MKLRKMQQLCFENGLKEFDLLLDFIKLITEKKEITWNIYEFDIDETEFYVWVKRFKSGNPVKFMNKNEVKSFISILMRYT